MFGGHTDATPTMFAVATARWIYAVSFTLTFSHAIVETYRAKKRPELLVSEETNNLALQLCSNFLILEKVCLQNNPSQPSKVG